MIVLVMSDAANEAVTTASSCENSRLPLRILPSSGVIEWTSELVT